MKKTSFLLLASLAYWSSCSNLTPSIAKCDNDTNCFYEKIKQGESAQLIQTVNDREIMGMLISATTYQEFHNINEKEGLFFLTTLEQTIKPIAEGMPPPPTDIPLINQVCLCDKDRYVSMLKKNYRGSFSSKDFDLMDCYSKIRREPYDINQVFFEAFTSTNKRPTLENIATTKPGIVQISGIEINKEENYNQIKVYLYAKHQTGKSATVVPAGSFLNLFEDDQGKSLLEDKSKHAKALKAFLDKKGGWELTSKNLLGLNFNSIRKVKPNSLFAPESGFVIQASSTKPISKDSKKIKLNGNLRMSIPGDEMKTVQYKSIHLKNNPRQQLSPGKFIYFDFDENDWCHVKSDFPFAEIIISKNGAVIQTLEAEYNDFQLLDSKDIDLEITFSLPELIDMPFELEASVGL